MGLLINASDDVGNQGSHKLLTCAHGHTGSIPRRLKIFAKPRYGYRRLHAVLERRGQAVNVKRVYRLYAGEGQAVRRRKRKRLVRERAVEPLLIRANVWMACQLF